MNSDPFVDEVNFDPVQLYNTTTFSIPIQQDDLIAIAREVSKLRDVAFEMVEFVYVDEAGIIEINKQYLDRDYVTDVISFRLDDGDIKAIEGTIYCCIPRIKEQALELKCDERTEFGRIACHGLLHLSGMDDATSTQKKEMTRIEDQILALWKM
jgi:probable rRNA maturation factor